MRKLTITKSQIIPSACELNEFENKIGFSLPLEYRKFLLEQNPKSVKESLFKKDNKEFWLEHFYPFNNEEKGSLQYIYSLFCQEVLPKEYLSFGYDAGGWQFIICIDGVEYGKIFYCRMDEEFENALTFIADDFGIFISELKDISDTSL